MRPVAGLAAALICALTLCPVPARHPLSGPGLILRAIGYLLAVAIAAYLAAVLVQADRKSRVRAVSAALWFAPLAIFAFEQRSWAVIPLILLVAMGTPLFGLTREPPGPPRQFLSSITAAMLVQSAAIEALLEHEFLAAALLSAGIAVAAWRATAVDPNAPLKSSRAWITGAGALLLVILGLLPFRVVTPGTSLASSAAPTEPGDAFDRSLADSYRAVVLLPERQPHVTLVPPLPALTRDPFRENKKTLQIPFYGVYWFFRRPDLRPPADAVEIHGTPVALTFRSHDSRQLVEEAHQSLGAPFQLACCSAIELAILNHNRSPGTVSIELILVDTFAPGRLSQSLGVLPVRSVYYPQDTSSGVAETLEFPIPPSPAIQHFDEFTIRFHRPFLLSRESSNIAIEGFTLKPR